MNKQAVVLFNMGGPNSLFEVEGFLKRLFSDPHILNIPNTFARNMVANFITSKRLPAAKSNYKAIGGGSPLIRHTLALTNVLNALDSQCFYTYCMRYTPPFAKDVFEDLRLRGVESLVLFSMYPQYSTTTTKSSLVDIKQALCESRYSPKIRVIERYFNNYQFCELIVKSIQEALGDRDPSEFTLLFSAHAIPQSLVKKGDHYPYECEQNIALVKEILDTKQIGFKQILHSYQSKLGPIKWVGPTTQNVIASLTNHKVLVFPLAFTIDNSETDYELSIECAHIAKEAGVREYIVARCFNEREDFAKFIISMAKGAFAQS